MRNIQCLKIATAWAIDLMVPPLHLQWQACFLRVSLWGNPISCWRSTYYPSQRPTNHPVYPKIGSVLSIDIDKLAQLMPGKIGFEAIDIQQAHNLIHLHEERFIRATVDKISELMTVLKISEAIEELLWGVISGECKLFAVCRAQVYDARPLWSRIIVIQC